MAPSVAVVLTRPRRSHSRPWPSNCLMPSPARPKPPAGHHHSVRPRGRFGARLEDRAVLQVVLRVRVVLQTQKSRHQAGFTCLRLE